MSFLATIAHADAIVLCAGLVIELSSTPWSPSAI
jgi:hypothetical protein